jgi:predicted PurR-regulated permease PerM
MISLQRVFWNNRGLAVTVMTLLLLCVLVVPLTFAVAAIAANLDDIAVWVKTLATFRLPPPPAWLASLPLIGVKAVELWDRIAAAGIQDATVRVAPYAGGVIKWFAAQLGSVGVLLLEFLLTVVLAAAMYVSGERATYRLLRFGQRLAGAGGENAIYLAGQTIRGVALGVVVTAIAQSVFAGIGLVIAGVPIAGALTGLMLLLSIAQIGVTLVLAGVAGWLYWIGESAWGTFMLIWMIIAATMDNFLRPVLIRKGADLPLLLVFAGVVGGLIAFGFIGIFVGPVILAVADKLLMAWIEGDVQQPKTVESKSN